MGLQNAVDILFCLQSFGSQSQIQGILPYVNAKRHKYDEWKYQQSAMAMSPRAGTMSIGLGPTECSGSHNDLAVWAMSLRVGHHMANDAVHETTYEMYYNQR